MGKNKKKPSLRELLEIVRKNQEIMIRQMLHGDHGLWSRYGRELYDIKMTDKEECDDSDSYERAVVYLLNRCLRNYEARSLMTKDEKKNFKKEVSFWMNRPLVKFVWKKYKHWISKEHAEFLGGTIKEVHEVDVDRPSRTIPVNQDKKEETTKKLPADTKLPPTTL
jgi:hypothetical protein